MVDKTWDVTFDSHVNLNTAVDNELTPNTRNLHRKLFQTRAYLPESSPCFKRSTN